MSRPPEQSDRNAADHYATCPRCGELSDAGRYSCSTCGAYLLPTTARERSFCRYCGTLTAYLDACCKQHRALLPLDDFAASDIRSRAMQAAPGEASQAREGKAV